MSIKKNKLGLIIFFNPLGQDLSFLLELLSQENYIIKTVSEEVELIDIIGYEPVSLILMNGYFACEKICKRLTVNHNKEGIPVLFILQEQELLASQKVFGIGAADYISYPYEKQELLARIDHQITIYRLKKENKKIKESWEKSRIQAEMLTTKDSLTQLPNRRQLEEYLHKEWLRCARERVAFGDADKTAISLILCDLDYFNIYNDQYGYDLGDNCLKMIADTIKETAKRPADLVARFDGSKLAILLPNTDEGGGIQVANILKTKIENLKINHAFSPIGEYLTVSMGIACAIPSQALAPDVLIGGAERALFEAKEQGGNRIVSDNF